MKNEEQKTKNEDEGGHIYSQRQEYIYPFSSLIASQALNNPKAF